jgi:hypothetical protein
VKVASGGFMEADVHGSQQYLPLMRLAIPKEMAEIVKADVSFMGRSVVRDE